jgi:CheY-like chemotaxis protein
VLVIDDEPAIVRARERWLGKHADVVGSTDPVAALAEALDGRFSLVLCDLNMPDMSGAEFVEALGAKNPDAARRVVIMTGSSNPGPPGTRIVRKPLRPQILQELLDGA